MRISQNWVLTTSANCAPRYARPARTTEKDIFMLTSTPTARVTITKDGPYIVTENVPLSVQTIMVDADGGAENWAEGKSFPVAETYALCRCGQSVKKPFCDGSHARTGFDGTETANRESYAESAQVFDGPTHKLMDVEALCASARFCDPNGKVWNQVNHTTDEKTHVMFLRQVGNCPSGRLAALDKETGFIVEPVLPVSIGLVEDPQEKCSGPLWLRGGIQVIAADGFNYEVRNRITLCRCGRSKNKPFCDGAHMNTSNASLSENR
jgi:CDGSH-type Zn-finger protein